MSLPASTHLKATCQFKKANGQFCKRSVAYGENRCWQHADNWSRKWKSLTRNQTIAFIFGVASILGLILTVAFEFRHKLTKQEIAKEVVNELPPAPRQEPTPPSQSASPARPISKPIPRTYLFLDGDIRFPQETNEGKLSAERNFKIGEQLFFNYFYHVRGPNPVQVFPNTRWIYLASDSGHATQEKIVKDFKNLVTRDWKNNPQFAKAYTLMHEGESGQWNTVFAYNDDGQRKFVTQKDLDDFKSGAVVIFVLAQIPYKDEGHWHHLRRCQFLVPPAIVPEVWHFCDSFNDSD